jgi:putative transposase
VHIIMSAHNEIGVPKLMQALNGQYVRHFNLKQGRTGTLWQGRYHSSLIDSERYYLACSRYVERNPVRAGMTRAPEDYEWTSFHANALGRGDPLITPHPLLRQLGSTDPGRRIAYRELFNEPVDEESDRAIRHAGRTNRPLGARHWKAELRALTGAGAPSFGPRPSDGVQAGDEVP